MAAAHGLARGVSWAKSMMALRSFLSQAHRKVTARCLPERRVEGTVPASAARDSALGKRARQSPISASRVAARTQPERGRLWKMKPSGWRSEEHTSELQSLRHLVCRLLLET